MIIGIIPARYASTRFPGKPLIDIEGKSMIQRVYEQAAQAKCLSRIIVATDDERIAAHVRGFGGEAIMTHSDHPSGTDRCWEAVKQIVNNESIQNDELGMMNDESIQNDEYGTNAINSSFIIQHSSLNTQHSSLKYIINIQGDEPFLAPEQIDELGAILDGNVEIASQLISVSDHEILFDEGEAKVIVNEQFEAIYFSRQVIPFLKGIAKKDWHKHHAYYRQVGMYAYRADVLEQITKLPVSPLERAESLEQLRWLQNGFKIKMTRTNYESHCIDTPEDVEKVLKMRAAGQLI